jgi:hypothetical protein
VTVVDSDCRIPYICSRPAISVTRLTFRDEHVLDLVLRVEIDEGVGADEALIHLHEKSELQLLFSVPLMAK